MKIFTSHFICKGSKRVTQGLRVRESWRPNITEIFWPQTYGRQCCEFLVLWCSTGGPEATLLGDGFLYGILSASSPDLNSSGPKGPFGLVWLSLPHLVSNCCNSTVLCSIRRPYIAFKLPRGDMDTPPRLRNSFRYLPIGMCHFDYLWNGLCDRHRAEITVMQFRGHSLPVRQSMSVPWEFFSSSHFISQFPPTRFPLITAIGMCHFLPVHHLEWHFGPCQKVNI